MVKLKKLNLGCGSNKLKGFINIDVEKSCEPDVICNFITDKLPYKANSVDEVVLFHTIEHISKRFHKNVLQEIWRVLKPSGLFMISYPEFVRCVENWKTNYRGKKEFWEATIYGRQLYPSDFHVCVMHTPDFEDVLNDCGFNVTLAQPEMDEPYNTIVACKKVAKPAKYEDLIAADMKSIKLEKS